MIIDICFQDVGLTHLRLCDIDCRHPLVSYVVSRPVHSIRVLHFCSAGGRGVEFLCTTMGA